MSLFLILPYYLYWHYTQAFLDIKNLWTNLIVFVYNFFSIPILVRTFFSPFERMKDSYGGRGAAPLYETFIFNTIMRFIGVIIRLIFIVMGATCILMFFLLAVLTFVVWIFLPVIMVGATLWGFKEILLS